LILFSGGGRPDLTLVETVTELRKRPTMAANSHAPTAKGPVSFRPLRAQEKTIVIRPALATISLRAAGQVTSNRGDADPPPYNSHLASNAPAIVAGNMAIGQETRDSLR
jgi:hypothetical protein